MDLGLWSSRLSSRYSWESCCSCFDSCMRWKNYRVFFHSVGWRDCAEKGSKHRGFLSWHELLWSYCWPVRSYASSLSRPGSHCLRPVGHVWGSWCFDDYHWLGFSDPPNVQSYCWTARSSVGCEWLTRCLCASPEQTSRTWSSSFARCFVSKEHHSWWPCLCWIAFTDLKPWVLAGRSCHSWFCLSSLPFLFIVEPGGA